MSLLNTPLTDLYQKQIDQMVDSKVQLEIQLAYLRNETNLRYYPESIMNSRTKHLEKAILSVQECILFLQLQNQNIRGRYYGKQSQNTSA